MNGTTPEIDRLKMERHKIDIELKRIGEKVKALQEEKKAIDNRIVIIKNSETGEVKSFNSMF